MIKGIKIDVLFTSNIAIIPVSIDREYTLNSPIYIMYVPCNSKYYCKKLKKEDGKGCKKINNLFKRTNIQSTVVTDDVETVSATFTSLHPSPIPFRFNVKNKDRKIKL